MFTFDGSAAAWLTIALGAAIAEVTIPHFGVIFVSVGAVAAAGVAALGFGFPLQIVVFLVALSLSFVLIRPRLMARMGGRGLPSRTDPLIGRQGVVTHDIDPTVGAGRVNVGGEDWAARAAAPLPAGTRIRVVAADGIVLEVTSA